VRPSKGESGIDWLGLKYQNLTPGLRQMHGIPQDVEGVWITDVSPSSPLYEEGVRPGNVISEVNGQKVDNVQELERIIGAARSGSFLRLYVLRIGQQRNERGVQPFFAVVRVP
jgi:serine protease Do